MSTYSTVKFEKTKDVKTEEVTYFLYYNKLENFNISLNIVQKPGSYYELTVYVDNKIDSDDDDYKEFNLLDIKRRCSLHHVKKLAFDVIKKKFDLVLIEV